MNKTPALNHSAASARPRNYSRTQLGKSRSSAATGQITLIIFALLFVINSTVLGGGDARSYRRTEVFTSSETALPQTIVPDKEDGNMRRTVEALDRLRKKVEEWGEVTISAPIAVLDSEAFAVPSDIVDAQQLYKDAEKDINGSAVQSLEVGIGNQFGASETTIVDTTTHRRKRKASTGAGSPSPTPTSTPAETGAS